MPYYKSSISSKYYVLILNILTESECIKNFERKLEKIKCIRA